MLKRIGEGLRRAADRRAYGGLTKQGFRIVKISFPNRIGHLCLETDALLKETILAGGKTDGYFLPDIGNGFANQHIVTYFRRYLTVAAAPGVVRYIESPTGSTDAIVETHPYAVAMYATARAYEVYARWGDRPPLFELTDDDEAALESFKAAVGMPRDAWFVCLHAREGGYSPIDEAIHKFRSVAIETYALAVDTITERGGWVVRMGDASMRPISPHAQIIDYALSPHKSAQLDVALGAKCRFFLGSSSGPTLLATIFGRPCVVAHMAPLGASLGVSAQDIALPQKLKNSDGVVIDFQTIMQGEYSHLRLNDEFISRGLVNEPNSAEEIDEAVREMIDRLDGVAGYNAEDEARQTAFKSLLRPGHYTYGSASRMGRDYLRRHFTT